jgi:predicted acylesterase/phospholipase RssA
MKRFLLSVLLFISAIGAAFPQSVGLVLSGGGAKGLAHIGVIKVLEDHNIPIDYVAGTSIGAIIAGLYATGYTPEEMLELFNSKEFRMWSTGKIDKESLYYFKKKDDFPEVFAHRHCPKKGKAEADIAGKFGARTANRFRVHGDYGTKHSRLQQRFRQVDGAVPLRFDRHLP